MVRAFHIKFGKQAQLHGRVLVPEVSYPVPGAILCHGFGSGRGAVRSSGLNLAKKGIASLIFDFRGHGRSGGIFDGNEVEDVVDAWQWLSQFEGVDSGRIALIGHSVGARAAIFAASKIDSPRAVVALACPPDLGEMLSQDASFDLRRWMEKTTVMEYPRDGMLPWLRGMQAIIVRVWMFLVGYRLRIEWHSYLTAVLDMKIADALQSLTGCSKLFVHSRGDKHIPYQAVMKLYQKAPEPKELIMADGGYHATPLMPGKLRKSWISWVVNELTAER